MELSYAGLHQLRGPFLDLLGRLPEPQREALDTMFGRNAGPAPDRFLAGTSPAGPTSRTSRPTPSSTRYTSCQPCPMCTGAIARSGLGRVAFALSSEQLAELTPPGAAGPDAEQVAYEGPALFAEARVPIDGYYA